MVLFDPAKEANERLRAHPQTANQGVLEGANTEPDVALKQYSPVEVMEKEHVFFLFKGLLDPLLKRLERSDEHLEHMLEELWRWRSFVDTPVNISANVFYEIDYKERMFVFCYSPVAITLATTTAGWTQALPAFQWTPVMLPRGTHVVAQGISDGTPQAVLFRACDEWITGNVSLLAGTSAVGSVTVTNLGLVNSGVTNVINVTGATTTQVGSDQFNSPGKGLNVWLNITAITAGSVQIIIEVKDPLTNQYTAVLTATAVTTVSNTRYTVYPGITVVAGQNIADTVAGTWRVRAVVVTGPATFTVDWASIL